MTNSVSADEKHSLATWQEDIAELIMEYTFSEEAVVEYSCAVKPPFRDAGYRRSRDGVPQIV